MIKTRLNQLIDQKASLLCIGLDPDVQKIPALFLRMQNPIIEFNRAVIDATEAHAIAYKANFAFYETLGLAGYHAIETLMSAAPKNNLMIADIKRADIGNTSRMYATAFFETFGFDAVTVPPYMGYDSLEPFIGYKEKFTFILCLTSNDGSKDFEEQPLQNGKKLYEAVLEKAKEWNHYENVGLVVGATKPGELKRLRELADELPFLIPGVGAQGGSLEDSVKHGVDSHGSSALINIGRSVIYPDGNFETVNQFQKAVAAKAADAVKQMRLVMKTLPKEKVS
jgi:orotidine-5'-phosphate decarboxylase